MGPTIDGIRAAAERIRPYVTETPLVRADVLSARLGADVWLKNETVTAVASFKIRGALNTMLSARSEGVSEVGTSSTGNHGQGVAYAGMLLKIGVNIFMPKPVNATKAAKTALYGAAVHECEGDIDQAKDQGVVYCRDKGARFLDDGNDPTVMEGAGTVALEVAESLDEIDCMIVPLGGGNLSAGCATALKSIQPKAKVVSVQAKSSPAVTRSFHAREKQEHPSLPTVAEGLVTRVPPDLALQVLWERLDDAWLADDNVLLSSVHTMAASAQVLVEPAGAASLAGLWMHREELKGKRVVLILTGANLTMDQLRLALDSAPLEFE